MKLDVLTADLIGDIALVIVVSSLLGAAARRCGQPRVVGQVLAGILLGPSVLGRLPGHLTSHLFPHGVVPYLSALAQVAIVIFMFVVGYDLDLRSLRSRSRAVPLVAAGAMLTPMSLGICAALLLRPEFAAMGERHIGRSFVLFLGVATSVTALPVLAAIIRERGIAGSPAGVTATAAAGIMDLGAWLVLAAAVSGTAGAPTRPWPVTLLLISCFAAVMLVVVRPALRWWIKPRPLPRSNQVLMAFVLAMGCAWVTASLGLHPVFGGFLAGLVMPSADGPPDAELVGAMEEVGGLLLPLFFVVTGLSLNVGALHGEAFALLALICVIAIAGKLGPAYAASRIGGLSPQDSAVVAALINTRGLTELIALNVGLTYGIIHQKIFTLLVLMALITTVMTAPLLSWIKARTPAAELIPEDSSIRE